MNQYINWPTWSNGAPVKVGEMAMSLFGPARIDSVEVLEDGWRLYHYEHREDGEKCFWPIDEGNFETDFPARADEECDFWEPGDPTKPTWTFRPVSE